MQKAYTDGFRATYSKGKNLENLLCRARLWPLDKNFISGWFPRNQCIACKHSLPRTDTLKFHYKQEDFKIKSNVTCKDSNIIYVIECLKCNLESIGLSITTFRQRSSGWRSDIKINTKVDKVISHFNLKDHSIKKDFRMTAMEKVYGSTDILRLRERMYIDYFELIEHGLNTKRT